MRVRMASGAQTCPITSVSLNGSRNSRVAASRSAGARGDVSRSLFGTRILPPHAEPCCQDAIPHITVASVLSLPRHSRVVSASRARNPTVPATSLLRRVEGKCGNHRLFSRWSRDDPDLVVNLGDATRGPGGGNRLVVRRPGADLA